MPHGGLDIAGVAASPRERLDALRTAGRVVDRPQHEMEAPQDLVRGQLRQALAQRGDEGAAGLVEVVGDELREERRIFGGQHGAQPGVLILAVAALDLGEGGPDERLDHRLELQAGAPGFASAAVNARRSASCNAAGTPRRAGHPCRGSSSPPTTSSPRPRRQSFAPRRPRSRARRTGARRRPGAARGSRRRADRAASKSGAARGIGGHRRYDTAGLHKRSIDSYNRSVTP